MWPPPFKGFFEWIGTLPGSQYLREDAPNFFGMFLTLHVLSLCLFLGLVLMMDLRLIGLAHLDTPVTHIQKRLFPWQFVGAIVMSKLLRRALPPTVKTCRVPARKASPTSTS